MIRFNIWLGIEENNNKSTEHEFYTTYILNAKMTPPVDILKFISRINTTIDCFKQKKSLLFSFYEQL